MCYGATWISYANPPGQKNRHAPPKWGASRLLLWPARCSIHLLRVLDHVAPGGWRLPQPNVIAYRLKHTNRRRHLGRDCVYRGPDFHPVALQDWQDFGDQRKRNNATRFSGLLCPWQSTHAGNRLLNVPIHPVDVVGQFDLVHLSVQSSRSICGHRSQLIRRLAQAASQRVQLGFQVGLSDLELLPVPTSHRTVCCGKDGCDELLGRVRRIETCWISFTDERPVVVEILLSVIARIKLSECASQFIRERLDYGAFATALELGLCSRHHAPAQCPKKDPSTPRRGPWLGSRRLLG
jgi:hypothetical protein